MSNDCAKQIDSIWPYMCSLITHRTSKRGKNKEVRYEPQASSVCDVFPRFHFLCGSSEFTSMAKWNLIFLLKRKLKSSKTLQSSQRRCLV